MDSDILKFIIDLGSIGAICFVVLIFVRFISEEQKRRIEEHKMFLDTIIQISNDDKK